MTSGTYLTELFPAPIRANGFGVGYSFALILPAFYAFYLAARGTLVPLHRHPPAESPATAGGQQTDGGSVHCESMATAHDHHVLALPQGLCHKCLRALSRRLRDLPGVVWFQVDAAAAQVLIAGDVDLAAAEGVIRELRCS